jgi:ectoine hydroxylase-related dioxygenase (phytanoyl-CoA dioxygenase family)
VRLALTSTPRYYLNNLTRPHPHKLNYAWQLDDINPQDGGFALIPGSHKMLYPIPRPDTTSIDLAAVKQLSCKAGSLVIYLGGSCAHCVFGWRGQRERRAVLSKAFPRMLDNVTRRLDPSYGLEQGRAKM